MKSCTYHTLDVFTERAFGGNPLAVFPDGAGLGDEEMQRVARELNLSETVFVLPPDDPAHACRLRIFTPGTELPFAGHPTVGTAHLLAAIGAVALTGKETRVVFEEGVGPVPVTIRAENGRPVAATFAAAKMPEAGPPAPDAAALADVLSLDAADIAGAPPPAAFSCGVPFQFVTVTGLDALARARVRLDVWERVLADHWAPSLYVLARPGDGGDGDAAVRARMFAPVMGIAEDPATGAAATALAGYLAPLTGVTDGTVGWAVDQGVEMGRPSRIDVAADLEAGHPVAIRVGGRSVVIAKGEMRIP